MDDAPDPPTKGEKGTHRRRRARRSATRPSRRRDADVGWPFENRDLAWTRYEDALRAYPNDPEWHVVLGVAQGQRVAQHAAQRAGLDVALTQRGPREVLVTARVSAAQWRAAWDNPGYRHAMIVDAGVSGRIVRCHHGDVHKRAAAQNEE
jgi:hypothetical protein